jgi:hypothetical protein
VIPRLTIACCLLAAATVVVAQVPLPAAPTWMSAETTLFGTGLDMGDIDGDGWLDLAVSNGNDMLQAPNTAYFNDAGVLPVTAGWTSGDQRYSGHCELADIDGDGFPELMVANYIDTGWQPAQVQVYDNVGGVLQPLPMWESPADIHTFRASFGDPDGDGDLDLAVATGEAYNGDLETNRVFFNHGGQLEAVASWVTSYADASYDARFVDIDQDGDQDLAFLGGGAAGRVHIHYNEGGVLQAVSGWISATADNGNTFDFDDLDRDGFPDLCVGFNSQLGGSGRFAAFLTGGGALPTSPTWTSDPVGYASAVLCGDLDGDGAVDLITGGWWEPVRVYLNDGYGGLPATADWQTAAAWESVVENLALGDIDEGRTRVETALFEPGGRLLQLPHRHLQGIDAVRVGSQTLPVSAWCGSRRDGWVSLADDPVGEIAVSYRVSDGPDLAVSNWDDAVFVFGSLLPTGASDMTPGAAALRISARPNPFNPRTVLSLDLAADAARASVRVYDLRGRLVDTLHDGPLAAGVHAMPWRPRGLASGVYLYRLEADGRAVSGKVALTK